MNIFGHGEYNQLINHYRVFLEIFFFLRDGGGGYFNAVDVFFYKFGLVLFPFLQPHQILVALKEDIELTIFKCDSGCLRSDTNKS